MSYFTERHGMRTPIKQTSTINVEMYSLLFNCCEKYYDNIAWKYPAQCPDGNGICGISIDMLNDELFFEIPTLFRKHNGKIAKPLRNDLSGESEIFDQYALLDMIELFANNIRDISCAYWHPFYRHNDLSFAETNNIFKEFQNEINAIFEKTGLLFILTEEKGVERKIEKSVLTDDIEAKVKNINEEGTRERLEEAVSLFRQPNPMSRKYAVDKIWDALERLKTYYPTLNKKTSVEKIVNDMSNGQIEFVELYNEEFKILTEIGNRFTIRHHETNKIDIIDIRHYDYLFNRCLALISLAINYLQQED